MSKLPGGWEFTPLSNVASVQSGIGFPIHYQGEKFGDLGFFKVGDISRAVAKFGGQLKEAQHYVSYEVSSELKGKPIPIGTTVFAKIGEAIRLNRRAFVVAECLIDNNVMAVKAFEPCSDLFLFRFMQTQDISELARSTTVPSLRKGDIEGLLIPLAPLNEQKRIADKLDAVLARVDACRDRLDRVPAILKRFRQSVLAAATSGKLTEEWRDEHSCCEQWLQTDIQSVAKVGTGSTPLRSNSAFFASQGTPWITSAATSQSVVLSAEEFVTDAAIAAHRLKRFPAGTLLVAMYGEGKTRGQVTELGLDATINQACAAIIVDESLALKNFVKFALQANYFEMRELAEGGNQPSLNLSKIKEFPLRLPPLEEQTEIVRRVESLFAYADRLEGRYASARAQTKRLTPALLAKAFRGELVPQDPNDEPASQLLVRIHAARAENETSKLKRGRKPAAVG